MILKIGLTAVVLLSIVAFAWSFMRGGAVFDSSSTPAPMTATAACAADARICPDGSAVGRVAPTCEFAACPLDDAREAEITTHLGGMNTRLFVTVSPRRVLSDSRCLAGVRCAWAGEVEVRTVITTPISTSEHTLRLGEPIVFGEHVITLVEVQPPPRARGPIEKEDYRFTFKIERVME